MKRYLFLLPFGILIIMLTAAWTGQTSSNLPAQAATPVPTQTPSATVAPAAGSPSTGVSGFIPFTGRPAASTAPSLNLKIDNKPQSSVGELPNAVPAEMQSSMTAAQDLPENVQSAVNNYLVRMLNAAPEKVLIVSAVKQDFKDACLGLALEDESCAATVTPGWLAQGIVNGSYYVVHANADGTSIRLENSIDNTGLTNFGRDFPALSVTAE